MAHFSRLRVCLMWFRLLPCPRMLCPLLSFQTCVVISSVGGGVSFCQPLYKTGRFRLLWVSMTLFASAFVFRRQTATLVSIVTIVYFYVFCGSFFSHSDPCVRVSRERITRERGQQLSMFVYCSQKAKRDSSLPAITRFPMGTEWAHETARGLQNLSCVAMVRVRSALR